MKFKCDFCIMDKEVEVTSPLALQQLAGTVRGYLGNHPLG